MELIEINYNELVSDPEPAVRRIASFVSPKLNAGQMMTAIDTSLYRNRDAAAPL